MKSPKHNSALARFADEELEASYKALGLDEQIESTIYFDTFDDSEEEFFL
jgi:hypothetical protein